MITPRSKTLSGNIDNIMHYELVISSMIASYLDSSINKKRLATANKLLELKYYAKIMTERIIKKKQLVDCMLI